MDVDFWGSKLHQTGSFSTSMQPTRLFNSEHHLGFDDSEGDDDLRACFPCPFCYVDIEMPSLCSHLQEEHCFDFKNAVCPLCAANLGKDIIGHFTLQHSSSLKRRRKAQRSGLWTNGTAMLGRELRELTSFLGVNSTKSGSSSIDSPSDPLLSPFLCNVGPRESINNPNSSSSINGVSTLERKKAWSLTSAERILRGKELGLHVVAYCNFIACLVTREQQIVVELDHLVRSSL